jgi:hypothetical protein
MTDSTNNTGSNVMIKEVKLFWAKLDKPVSPFGTDQWELSIQAPKKREKELAMFGKIKAGFEPGTVAIQLKKKALKRDGSDAAKVRVVDCAKKNIDSKTIGNGSVGNVIVFQQEYQIKSPNGKVTKEGTSTMLTAVQVVELIKYEPKNTNFVDFDEEMPEGVAASTETDEDVMF